ncbi:MAG: hypothetical protein WC657_05690 [Candidatus Paceibacterota bacterium]|jgi:hypothetical protein
MEKINLATLAALCVRNEDGTIDVQSTLYDIEDALDVLRTQESESLAAIANAVHQVFDAHLGQVLSMPAVCSIASGLMGVTPQEFVETQKAVGLWVRTSNQFRVAKGKGGGVTRLRDIPEKA